MSGWISAAQFERDHNGLRDHCAACGNPGRETDRLVVDNRGMRVHHSHTTDPASGLYGTQQRVG
jgi:hypothetical protein